MLSMADNKTSMEKSNVPQIHGKNGKGKKRQREIGQPENFATKNKRVEKEQQKIIVRNNGNGKGATKKRQPEKLATNNWQIIFV